MPDPASAKTETIQGPRPARWPVFLALIGLLCLVLAVFFPVVRFEFVGYDVQTQVIENSHIQGLTGENVEHIFTSWCITSFYPVRTLTYALDHHFWGMDPAGFKLTNGLIHLANVLLVFWLVLRLFRGWAATGQSPGTWDVPLAAFSAAVFAAHPVVVEPVTWVAGREELLLTLGALGCIHFHVTAGRLQEQGGQSARAVACHVAAAFCCALACLSNAAAAVIPFLIVAWDLVMLPRPKPRTRAGITCTNSGKGGTSLSAANGVFGAPLHALRSSGTCHPSDRLICARALRRILYGSAALWAMSGATILIKRLGPEAISASRDVGLFSAEHLMLVLNVYWLNLKTLVWPAGLALTYSPVEPESFLEGEVILGGLALGLTGLLLWQLRRRKLVLLGLLWFVLALLPASQIIVHHVHRADRFLYLPLIGLAMAVAMAAGTLRSALDRRVTVAALVTAGALSLLALVVRSTAQVRTWQSSLSVWTNCVQVDPNNALAHDTLAGLLLKRGELARAAEHYKKAIQLDWHRPEVLRYLALQSSMCHEVELRDYDRAILLARRACELTGWKDRKFLAALATVYRTLGGSLAARGEFQRAVERYRQAIQTDPEDVASLFDLGFLLSMCPDKKLRNPREAVRLAEKGCQLTEHSDPVGLMILAAAYAQAGQFEAAISTLERALALAQDAGDPELGAELRYRLGQYQNGIAELETP